MRDDECVSFLQWALPRVGMQWPGFRKVRKQVRKRLARRLDQLGLAGLDAYRGHLEADPAEWQRLDALCRITISRFYRDRGVFDHIDAQVLPAVAAAASGVLRVWCAGCAGGEEPYTVSILWHHHHAARHPRVDLQIVATDADPHQLERAGAGVYAPGCLKDLPVALREAAFVADAAQLRLAADYRRAVRFLHQDVRAEQPAGEFALIFCRNLVFTYHDADTQQRLATQILARLGPAGFLVLGKGEELPAGLDVTAVAPHLGIYQRAPAQTQSGDAR